MQARLANFRTTRWSLVQRAQSANGAQARAALEDLCQSYWYPLYAFARRGGRTPSDAEDEVQAFFVHLIEKRGLETVDRQRGRFRTFLLSSFKNLQLDRAKHERAQKRGGGARLISLDAEQAEARYGLEPASQDTPEHLFSRAWAEALLCETLDELRESYEARGQAQAFDTLKGALVGDAPSYAELAESLGTSEGGLRVAAHRLRGRFREILLRRISDTVESPAEAEEELAELFHSLKRL